jgi:hypothetical protein
MPINDIIELFDSGAGSLSRSDDGTFSREVTLKWLLKDLSGYLDAETKLRNHAPDYYRGHFRQRLDCQPLGNGWWLGSASYASPAVNSQGDEDNQQSPNLFPSTVAFDTSGGTEHITQAYLAFDGSAAFGFHGEYRYAKQGQTAPDYKGAINVSGDSVNGLDVVVPVFNFTETWTVPTVFLTNTYVSTLYQLTGKTNEAQFRVFQAGECLFLGARCEATRGDFKTSITFSFSARPNATNKKIGDITVSTKKGWQYLWIEYESSVDNANLIKRPKYVYVDDIYGSGDFSLLRIGTNYPSLYAPAATGPSVPNRG